MSTEDLPALVNSENNDEESSGAVLSGILLLEQEIDEPEAQDADTENQYVMHEIEIEIMECDDDMKPEMTLDEVPCITVDEVEDNKDVYERMSLAKDGSSGIIAEKADVNENTISNDDTESQDNFQVVVNTNKLMIKPISKENIIHLDHNADISTDNAYQEYEFPEHIDPDSRHIEEHEMPLMGQNVNIQQNTISDDSTESQDMNKIVKAVPRREIIHHEHNADMSDSPNKENELPKHYIGTDYDRRPTRPIVERVMPPMGEKANIQLFTIDTGPQMYKAKGSLVTAPIITKNLPKVFDYLPIHGKPQDSTNLNEYFAHKIREFVGCGLTDYEFQQLEDYCSPEQLKTGDELEMEANFPNVGLSDKVMEYIEAQKKDEAPDLSILRKNKLRIAKDPKGLFAKKLKYRGIRSLLYSQDMFNMATEEQSAERPDVDLEPGKDIVYRVRVYRPYTYTYAKDRFTRCRHSVFHSDILLTGRNKLSDLRDRFVCHNDFDMRVDVSNHPDMLPTIKPKEVFPSGFMFINNVFYVDTRSGCVDYSEQIREWARKKDLGEFRKKDMCAVRLEDLTLKLGYPEVYMHQGACEHLFIFSEVRLLNPTDPLRLYKYPCSTAVAQNQTIYCTTCAEFPAKWVVEGSVRVPFDPAFFCDNCFRDYNYINGAKEGHFKAYAYRGNAMHSLKPQ